MSSSVIFPAQPEQILKGLGKLWTSLGEEEKQHGKPTVLRACAMTLIVATEQGGAFCASQDISDLVHEHPSRGIVLTVSDEAEHDLEARVLAQCWKPFGKAQQICCEQIEITARPESWPNVGPTLVGLTVADLPVIFWCQHGTALSAGATPQQKAGIAAVMELAAKVIVDTISLETSHALNLLARWQDEGRTVGDLQWTRLTQWREPLSHIFDNAARENRFSAFHTIEIAHTDETPSAASLYMAGWLSAPAKARVSFVRERGYGPGLHRVTLHADNETIIFERAGKECMTLRSTNGRQRHYTYAEPSLTSLMTEELSVLAADPSFTAAFRRAMEILHAMEILGGPSLHKGNSK